VPLLRAVLRVAAADEAVHDLSGEGVDRPTRELDRHHVEMRRQRQRRGGWVGALDPVDQGLASGSRFDDLPRGAEVFAQGSHRAGLVTATSRPVVDTLVSDQLSKERNNRAHPVTLRPVVIAEELQQLVHGCGEWVVGHVRERNPFGSVSVVGRLELAAGERPEEVDENDMVRVVIGQKALITMDSYKGQVFEATVDKIYPIMDERSRTFKIEAHFVNPPKKLYPNLTAEANIIIQTKKNTITIPKSYLIQGEYVLVNKDEKRKVKTGLSDYQKVEILEGLKAEETIYKPE